MIKFKKIIYKMFYVNNELKLLEKKNIFNI